MIYITVNRLNYELLKKELLVFNSVLPGLVQPLKYSTVVKSNDFAFKA